MVKNTKESSSEPRKLWGWILIYSVGDTRSTKFIQMMILGWPLTFLPHSQISVLVVAILEECCMASADMQSLFYSGEQIGVHGPFVFLSLEKLLCRDLMHDRLVWVLLVCSHYRSSQVMHELTFVSYKFYIFRRPGKIMTINGKSVINMASLNFLGLLGDETIEVGHYICYIYLLKSEIQMIFCLSVVAHDLLVQGQILRGFVGLQSNYPLTQNFILMGKFW